MGVVAMNLFVNVITGSNFGTIRYAYGTTAGATVLARETTRGTIETGRWTHVCATHLSGSITATDVKIYINGTENAVYGVSQNGVGKLGRDDLCNLYIGNVNSFVRANSGWIEEIAWWNAVLTQDEVTLLNSSRTKHIPLMIQPSNLIGYFSMNEFPDNRQGVLGDSIVDMSPNRFVGLLTNGLGGAMPIGLAEQVLSYP